MFINVISVRVLLNYLSNSRTNQKVLVNVHVRVFKDMCQVEKLKIAMKSWVSTVCSWHKDTKFEGVQAKATFGKYSEGRAHVKKKKFCL